MDEKFDPANNETGSLFDLSNPRELPYEELRDYLAAKHSIIARKNPKYISTSENTAFLQACSSLYKVGPKLFSATNYALLQQYPKLAEDILIALRPSYLKALFGHYKGPQDMIENRLAILSVLHKNSILRVENGKIEDQDWLLFLNALDAEKLDQYAKIFAAIDEGGPIENPEYFLQVKAHNDLESLPAQIRFHNALKQGYAIENRFAEDTQIKGFTLVNEYVCKRTRFFPKPWKQAMRLAWEIPSLENSFELYKLYVEIQNWLDGYQNFPIIYRFLSYFYSKPIFKIFDAEPLTQVCKMLHSVKEFNIDNYTVLANLPEKTALEFCHLLSSKEILTTKYIQKIANISETILQSICEANTKQRLTLTVLNVLLRLGSMGVDASSWLVHKPNWLVLSSLNNQSLKLLSTLELTPQLFEKITFFSSENYLGLFEQCTEDQQKDLLNNENADRLLHLLRHLKAVGLLTPENTQSIFANQGRLLADTKTYKYILNIEKTYTQRDQKKLNRAIATKQNTASQARKPSHVTTVPTAILFQSSDEESLHKIAQKLQSMGITISTEELGAYSPAVLQAFYAAIPLFQEDNLLNAKNIKYMLRLFSSAPNPQDRCRCIIILSQCGLLRPDKLYEHIGKLEYLIQQDPALFQEIYAEAWVHTETNSSWLQTTITAGLQEPGQDNNTEENLIKRYSIENEENAAYLALDDTKQRIASHPNAPLLQQTLKLLDKSKLNIESVLDLLMLTNEKQIQKLYAWLFILDKTGLLDLPKAQILLSNSQNLVGNSQFLKKIVTSLKAQPDFKGNTLLQQKHFNQLMQRETQLPIKQRILEYMDLAIHNPSAAAKFTFMAAEVAEVAGEKAGIAQDKFFKTAEKLASATNEMGQRLYGKMKLFSSKLETTMQPTVAEILVFAKRSEHFQGSYYQSHLERLTNDLTILRSQNLLSQPNVQWLMEQPQQETLSRCLTLLGSFNMLKDDEQWQTKLQTLVAYGPEKIRQIEKKCAGVMNSSESKGVQENTVQMWLQQLITKDVASPRLTR